MGRGHGFPWRRGGILGLWRLLLANFETLEADFARFYHLDLAEVVFANPSRRVPLRRLRSLIIHLPADAAFVRVISAKLPPTPAPWHDNEALLAIVAELVDKTNRILERAFSKKGTPAPKPIRIPRPGEHRPKPLPMSHPRARAFFAGVPIHYEAAADTTNGDGDALT